MSKNKNTKVKKPASKARARTRKLETKTTTLSSNVAAKEGVKESVSKPFKQSKNSKAIILNQYVITAFIVLISMCIYFSWPYWSLAPIISFEHFTLKNQQRTPSALLEKNKTISNDQLAFERQQLNKSLGVLMERMKTIEMAVVEVKKLAQATTPPSEKTIDSPAFNKITDRLETLEKNDVMINELLKRIKQIKENEIKRKKEQVNLQVGEKSQKNSEAVYQKTIVPNNTAKLILSLEKLRQAMASNGPFNKPLNALKKIAGNNLNINTAVVLLSKYSVSGIPNIPSLKQSFDKISGKIIQAARYNNDPGWKARVLNRLASLAVWRRIDGKGEKNSIDTIVTSAELKLKAGNLRGAVSILEGLSKNSNAAAIARPWMTIANKRIAADRALNSLHINAISNLTRIDPEKEQKK